MGPCLVNGIFSPSFSESIVALHAALFWQRWRHCIGFFAREHSLCVLFIKLAEQHSIVRITRAGGCARTSRRGIRWTLLFFYSICCVAAAAVLLTMYPYLKVHTSARLFHASSQLSIGNGARFTLPTNHHSPPLLVQSRLWTLTSWARSVKSLCSFEPNKEQLSATCRMSTVSKHPLSNLDQSWIFLNFPEES